MTLKLHMSLSEEDYMILKEAEEKTLNDEYLRDMIEDLNREIVEEDMRDKEHFSQFLLKALKIAYMDGFYSGITAVEKIALPLDITE